MGFRKAILLGMALVSPVTYGAEITSSCKVSYSEADMVYTVSKYNGATLARIELTPESTWQVAMEGFEPLPFMYVEATSAVEAACAHQRQTEDPSQDIK